jgi:5-methylcytosine-specific restriction endonuclease McrA
VAEYGAPVVATRDQFEPVRAFVTPADADALLFEREIDRGNPYPQERHGESWVASEQKMLVKFLASHELIEKFEQVKALLSHRKADATFADVLEVVLDEYVNRHSPEARQKRREARQAAATRSGKFSTVGADGSARHIPAGIRDEVFLRDNGQCTYVAPDGTRCASRHGLQVDHIRPYSAGGAHDPSNLRLLCGAHNRLAAEHALGRHVMARFWRRQ